MTSPLTRDMVTFAQAQAIAAQTMVYYQPETPCQGLAEAPQIMTDAEQLPVYAGTLRDGQVAVVFRYVPEGYDGIFRTHHGLEVTVYAQDGSVVTSQDYG